MRKLKTSDIPVLLRCLKKVGLKEQFKAVAQTANSVAEMWNNGYDFLWGLFDAITEESGEYTLYEFLAGPFEMTPEEVRDLDMDILLTNMQQLATENNLTGFFKFAAASMK
jgi:hypothetical protein